MKTTDDLISTIKRRSSTPPFEEMMKRGKEEVKRKGIQNGQIKI